MRDSLLRAKGGETSHANYLQNKVLHREAAISRKDIHSAADMCGLFRFAQRAISGVGRIQPKTVSVDRSLLNLWVPLPDMLHEELTFSKCSVPRKMVWPRETSSVVRL
jgi:hypothetical protein